MDLIYVGVLLCALAFVVVVVYASLVLKRAANTMETLSETLDDVEKKMHYITPELRKTVDHTGQSVDDLNEKINAADSVVATLENVGTSINASHQLLRHKAQKFPGLTSPRFMNQFTESIMWGDVAFQMYRKWRNGEQKEHADIE